MGIKRPVVLILDSGIGGLSIYFLMRKILPQIHYIYFFDNEVFPYGKCSEEFIFYRVFSIIKVVWKLIKFDLVIIACNTASVVSLHKLRLCFCFPIFGVFPAVKLAVNFTRNGVIGFLATYRTICHPYTLDLVKKFASQCVVLFLDVPEFVNLAELKIYGSIWSSSALIFYDVLNSWLKLDCVPDTVVLGCTHFSFLKDEFYKVFPEGSCFVDSHTRVVWDVFQFLYKRFFLCHVSSFFVFKGNQAYCSVDTLSLIKMRSLLFNFGFVSLEVLSI